MVGAIYSSLTVLMYVGCLRGPYAEPYAILRQAYAEAT